MGIEICRQFQSPIGWGLSCDGGSHGEGLRPPDVSIPYWLGSKLRFGAIAILLVAKPEFQSPIGWGLSCDLGLPKLGILPAQRFNPLLVGV